MLDLLKVLPDNSIDSIVTDGPYGLEFMGEEWDTFTESGLRVGASTEEAKADILSGAAAARRHGASIERDAKSAGGYGADSPTNENAFAAARVRYGSKLWTERPKKQERRAEGENRPFDGSLPVFTGGMLFQRWNEAWARECLRVLKPGGFLLAFGGGRTYHRLACGIEDAGFEIRDIIDWVYGSGFPKSSNVERAVDIHVCRQSGRTGRHYEVNLPKPHLRKPGDHVCPSSPEGRLFAGVGTAIKPGKEPICMARKPFKGSVAMNVLLWGTGGLNIQACRVNRDAGDVPGWHKSGANGANGFNGTSTFRTREMTPEEIQARCGDVGRWPSNLILDEEAGAELDAQGGFSKSTGNTRKNKGGQSGRGKIPHDWESTGPADAGGASRFFYCPKPSKREKDLGLDEFAEQAWVQWQTANGTSKKPSSLSEGRDTKRKNIHPTIKPVTLMRYLCQLVTPPGGVILDHLAGSATTGVGALTAEGFNFSFIGFEKNPEYYQIGLARLTHAEQQAKAQSRSSGQLDGSNGRPDSRYSTSGGGTVPTIRRKPVSGRS